MVIKLPTQQPKVKVEISFIYEIVSPVIGVYVFDLSSSEQSDIKQFTKHFDTLHGFKNSNSKVLPIISGYNNIIFNIYDINNFNILIYD